MRAIRHFFTRYRSDDRGVVAIFTAIAMAVLVGFVGFAVDVGMVYNERRQEQSAADVAALSGARQWILGSATEEDADETGDQFIFDAVVELSHKNMNNPPPYDEWKSAFVACEDPDHYTPLNVAEGTVECISKRSADRANDIDRAIRVRLPDTTVDTAFARVVGFSEWTVSAFAEAGLTEQPGAPNIIPFSLGAMGDGSGLVCLRTPTPGQSNFPDSDCSGPDQGNFGYLSIPRPSFDSNQNCNGGHHTVMRQNIAQGIDHALAERAGISEGNYTDPLKPDTCEEIAAGIEPNHMFLRAGNVQNVMHEALVSGTNFDDGEPARLKRYPEGDWPTRCIRSSSDLCGHHVDNRPLWDYFDPDLSFNGIDAPVSCDPEAISAHADPRQALVEECLADFENGNFASILTDEILESPRFTWLPEAWEDISEFSGTSEGYNIRRFRPVFLQTLYYVKDANNWWAIDTGWDAEGEPLPIRPVDEQPDSGGTALEGLSAIVLELDLLPQHIQDEGPTAGNFQSRIALIR